MDGDQGIRHSADAVNMAKNNIFVVISIIYCCTSLTSAANVDTLELVSVVYRHGDRTPIHMIPKDLYNESSWPLGLGQLTVRGIAQEKELGQYLRQQYVGYLNPIYNRKELYVQSTDVDRTLISAQSVIASLYPSTAEERSITGLSHQLVPIHTQKGEKNPFRVVRNKNCSGFQEVWGRVSNSTEYKEFVAKYQDIFTYLSNKTGLADITPEDTHGIHDTMYIEKLYNMTWPSWMNEEIFRKLYYEVYPMYYFYEYGIPAMARYNGGPIVQVILRNMKLRQDGLLNDPPYKMLMYSAHDSTIGALMGALQVFNNLTVPYSTAVMVELHKREGSYFVELYLRNDTKHDRYPMTIPGCTFSCPMEDFVNLTSSVLPDDYDDLCGSSFSWLPFKTLPVVIAVTMAISIALLLVILTLGVCCVRRCKRKPIRTRNYGKIRVDMHQEEMPMMLSGTGSDLDD